MRRFLKFRYDQEKWEAKKKWRNSFTIYAMAVHCMCCLRTLPMPKCSNAIKLFTHIFQNSLLLFSSSFFPGWLCRRCQLPFAFHIANALFWCVQLRFCFFYDVSAGHRPIAIVLDTLPSSVAASSIIIFCQQWKCIYTQCSSTKGLNNRHTKANATQEAQERQSWKRPRGKSEAWWRERREIGDELEKSNFCHRCCMFNARCSVPAFFAFYFLLPGSLSWALFFMLFSTLLLATPLPSPHCIHWLLHFNSERASGAKKFMKKEKRVSLWGKEE